jgi:hypothetical protein
MQAIDFFLLDEPLQLRYNLPATGWSLVPLHSAPTRAEEVDGSLAIIPDQRGVRECRPSHHDDHSGVVQQAGHAALDRRIGVRIPAPEPAPVGIEAGFV